MGKSGNKLFRDLWHNTWQVTKWSENKAMFQHCYVSDNMVVQVHKNCETDIFLLRFDSLLLQFKRRSSCYIKIFQDVYWSPSTITQLEWIEWSVWESSWTVSSICSWFSLWGCFKKKKSFYSLNIWFGFCG